MKSIYVNSRLHPLLLDALRLPKPRTWVFSRGEPWLLLTPERLGALADRLGPEDGRVRRLVELVRRHAPHPEFFCRRLGLEDVFQIRPRAYPPALCPRCDGVHNPHPEDVGDVCGDCRDREARAARRRAAGGELRDRLGDRKARVRIREKAPGLFDGDVLSPNYKINKDRKLVRDWDAAANRILHGRTYKEVAREFNCSVGLLHRKVREARHWENN